MRTAIRSLIVAAALLAARTAFAQPAVQQVAAPTPTVVTTAEGDEGHASTEEAHGDPTRDFNMFNFSYRGKDIAGGPMGDNKIGIGPDARPLAPGEEEEPMSAPFILMVVNFGILLILLAKVAAPKARKLAETRSDSIKTALQEAAALRQQAQAKLDEYSAKLSAAEAEIAALVDAMRRDAEVEKQRVVANAEAQAIALKKDADERIAAEIANARATLTREVALAATAAAETLLRSRATAGDQTNLVEQFIGDLQIQAASGAGKART